MALRTARLFVGNLPLDIDEASLKKVFARYGEITNIKVTTKPNMPPFAHINLSSDDVQISRGVRDLNQSSISGSCIRVEEAKESFLDRLKREQESIKSADLSKAAPPVATPSVQVRSIKPVVIQPPASFVPKKKKRKRDSSDDEEEFKWKIKPFSGTKASEKGIEVEVAKSHQPKPSSKTERKETNHSDILKTLESFSAEWGDSDTEVVVKKPRSNEIKEQPQIKSIKVSEKESKEEQNKKHIDKRLKKETDNEKRLKSLEERKNAFSGQKELVKAALMSIDGGAKSKKIRFDDQTDNDEEISALNQPLKTGKDVGLFEDSEGSDFEPDFSDKPQFEGEKGKELYELQSRFSKDERFKLDERFAESAVSASTTEASEKERQLKILSEITGVDVTDDKRRNEAMVRKSTFTRYDPTQEKKVESKPKKKKVAEEPKIATSVDISTAEEDKAAQERFFETSENLTNLFAEKQSFSLLQSFGVATEEEKIEESAPSAPVSDRAVVSERAETAPVVPPKNLWVEPFFFKPNDERFQEGQDFFYGHVEDPEEYRSKWYEKRQDLVKIYRSHHRRMSQLKALKKRRPVKKRS